MNQFQRLFHPIKVLRAERDAEIALRIEMEDQLRRAQGEIAVLRDERDTARAEALHASQAVADWIAQLKFGRGIFNPSPMPLPEKSETDLTHLNRRPRAREVVNRMTEEFYAQYDQAVVEQAARQAATSSEE